MKSRESEDQLICVRGHKNKRREMSASVASSLFPLCPQRAASVAKGRVLGQARRPRDWYEEETLWWANSMGWVNVARWFFPEEWSLCRHFAPKAHSQRPVEGDLGPLPEHVYGPPGEGCTIPRNDTALNWDENPPTSPLVFQGKGTKVYIDKYIYTHTHMILKYDS